MGQLIIKIFQMIFSSWIFSITSDFLSRSTLSCFTRTLMIQWLSVPPNASRGSFLPIKFHSFYSWFGRGMGTVLLDSLRLDDNTLYPVLQSLFGRHPPKFQRWTAHAGTGGFDALSSASLKENLSERLDDWTICFNGTLTFLLVDIMGKYNVFLLG